MANEAAVILVPFAVESGLAIVCDKLTMRGLKAYFWPITGCVVDGVCFFTARPNNPGSSPLSTYHVNLIEKVSWPIGQRVLRRLHQRKSAVFSRCSLRTDPKDVAQMVDICGEIMSGVISHSLEN